MKKFFITFLILIVLAVVCFFFGWVQFQVPAGQYGVINSKTHGFDPKPVSSGEFRWIWYKLLPTNVKISCYNLNYPTFPIDFNSRLPSGETYASFLGLTNADFSWELHGEISFNLKPEYLVQLAKLHNFAGQEDLDAYMKKTAGDIELLILRNLSLISSVDDSNRVEKILSGDTDEQMESEIRAGFPEINEFAFKIKTVKTPDFILYRQLRLMYEEFLTKQREYVNNELGRKAENHINSQLRINELEQYGEILSKYPILLDYLKLEQNNRN